MEKSKVLDALIAALDAELKASLAASKDAADYATSEESRAESKWDTQGLEASYLAAGQAEQARQWSEAIDLLQGSRSTLLASHDQVGIGSLVSCDLGGDRDLFFLAPAGGGQVVSVENEEVTVITLQSPIAVQLAGKRAGEGFTLPNGTGATISEVA